MPIYEYRCKDCKKEMTHLVLSMSAAEGLTCKHCGSPRLAQMISRFATPRSEESRLESMADPSKFGDLDENDPKSMARWMKRMGKEMGEDVGEDFDQAIEEAMDEEGAGGEGGPGGVGGAATGPG